MTRRRWDFTEFQLLDTIASMLIQQPYSRYELVDLHCSQRRNAHVKSFLHYTINVGLHVYRLMHGIRPKQTRRNNHFAACVVYSSHCWHYLFCHGFGWLPGYLNFPTRHVATKLENTHSQVLMCVFHMTHALAIPPSQRHRLQSSSCYVCQKSCAVPHQARCLEELRSPASS